MLPTGQDSSRQYRKQLGHQGEVWSRTLPLKGNELLPEGRYRFLVCWVGRGWMAMFDHPEFWNPKVRAADCLNPTAARSVLP